MNLFELYAKLGLDTSEFEAGIESSKSKFSGLKDVFAGTFLADLAKQGLNFALDMGKQAVNLASDLAEVQNVVDVTFGDGAATINAWAKSAKSAFGMSELSAKKFSGTMGSILNSMGFSSEETMEMSTSLVELAGDMASFYNLDHETAFEKIRSGIAGETEPLKQLGINMSTANLEAYAMSQGITKAYSAMTQAEQATLRYNYLLSTTANAQGDFARTSESYSNQIKLLQTNVNDILSQAGTALIDLITPSIQKVNELLSSLTKKTAEQQIADIEKAEQEELLEAELKKARADTLINTLDELSKKTELSEYETKLWENALQELVATFPELASHIDLANNSIITSTDEIRENTEAAWENAREKAKIRALEQKEQVRASALEAYADAQLSFDLRSAEANYYQGLWDAEERKQRESFEALVAEREAFLREYYGVEELDVRQQVAAIDYARKNQYTADQEVKKEYEDAVAAREKAREALLKSSEEYETADKAYTETAAAMEALVEKTNEEKAATEAATEAQNAYNTALENEVKTFETVEKAWESVKKHRDDTYKQMRESLKNGTNDLWGVVADLTDIDINKSMETAQANMSKNMAFYAEYAANLRNAQRAGVDEGLLAELSREQTAENYALLEYLYTQANPQEINRLNESWKHLQSAKDSLATTMTDASLAVDEGYASMVETAKKAVDELNQYETARQNAIDTGAGVTDGLSAAIPEIEAKVQEINAIIQSVGATPISIDFGIGGVSGGLSSYEAATERATERGMLSAMTRQSIRIDTRGLSGALAPSISAAIARQTVEGRYG